MEIQPATEAGRRFVEICESHVPTFRERAALHDRDASFPAENFEDLKKSGAAGAFAPADLGGLGLDSVHDWATGIERLARGDASEDVSSLQDDDPLARAGHHQGCGQGVVTSPDHHRIEWAPAPVSGHQTAPFRSISWAARAPGAPMTPPPGCAPEAQSHRDFTGVAYRAQPDTGRWKSNCSSPNSPWKMFPSESPNSCSKSQGVRT